MEFRIQQRTDAPWGGAAIVILNVIVLLLIVGLAGGYYYVQMRPKRAADQFAMAREHEVKGHISSAELHYRKAAHLEPGNIHYQRSLDALLRGEGNLEEIEMEKLSSGPRSASAALWPKDARVSSTPSLAGVMPKKELEPQKMAAESKVDAGLPGGALPTLESKAPPEPKPEPKPKPERRDVEIEVVAPSGTEFEIRAVNVENHVPGQPLAPWAKATKAIERKMMPGKYEIAVRAPWANPVVESFSVGLNGVSRESVRFEFGLLKIGGEPVSAEVYDEASGERVGTTPWVALRHPGKVALTVKAKGYEPSALEGEVEARGVLHFNHRLAKAGSGPAAAIEPAAVARTKTEPVPVPKPVPPKPMPVPVLSREPVSAPKSEVTISEVEKMIARDGGASRTQVEPAPVPAPVPVPSGRPVFGQSFAGPDGVIYLFGAKSNRGDPFWMSRSAPLAGRSDASSRDFCAQLTSRERTAGRVPEGYAYFPSLARDGRIALCVEYTHGGSAAPVVAKPIMKPEVLPIKKPLVLSDTAPPRAAEVTTDYRNHVAAGSGVAFGESFLNGDRVWMEYGKSDSYGNPFWASATGVIVGMSATRANQYCWDLTKRERAAGRIPGGYRYFPVMDGSGKVVLGRTVPTSVSSAGR